MANRKQNLDAAIQDSVRDANEKAAADAAARPTRAARRQDAKLDAVREAIQDVPVSDVKKAFVPSRNIPSIVPADTAKPHKRAAKDQAAVAAVRDAGVAAVQARQESFRSAAQTSNDLDLLRAAAVAKHAQHVKELNDLKRKFPKVPSIQALQPRSIREIHAELAGSMSRNEAEALTAGKGPTDKALIQNRINTSTGDALVMHKKGWATGIDGDFTILSPGQAAEQQQETPFQGPQQLKSGSVENHTTPGLPVYVGASGKGTPKFKKIVLAHTPDPDVEGVCRTCVQKSREVDQSNRSAIAEENLRRLDDNGTPFNPEERAVKLHEPLTNSEHQAWVSLGGTKKLGRGGF